MGLNKNQRHWRSFPTAVLLIFILTAPLLAQPDTTGASQYVGDWYGEGRFYNVNLHSELGVVRFSLRVTEDLEITGTVGNAEIIDGEIEVDDWNDGYAIKGSVVGQMFPGEDFHKKRITLLLEEVEDEICIGDFHLANNDFFDFTMRPGSITLTKGP